jgi:hypothetical protein
MNRGLPSLVSDRSKPLTNSFLVTKHGVELI